MVSPEAMRDMLLNANAAAAPGVVHAGATKISFGGSATGGSGGISANSLAPVPAPIDPCLVLWQAMNEAEKVGNRTDDKLVVEFLRRAGYGIAALAATPAPAPAPLRPTQPGWYIVLPPDFKEPTVRAFGKDGRWWIPLGRGNGDDGWMTGREYQNWVGPIADIDARQPFLAIAPEASQGKEPSDGQV